MNRGPWIVAGISMVIASVALWLWLLPPAMIRVATSYAAKMVCSNVFIAGRDPELSMREDVREQGHPIMKFINVSVDQEKRTVHAQLLGFAGNGLAVAREGTGCATVPDGDVKLAEMHKATNLVLASLKDAAWPEGESVSSSLQPDVQALLKDTALTGPGMRAVVVIKNGRVVAEAYGPGFDAKTPLLGWSMTKTVTAALIGTLVGHGKLKLDQNALLPEWKEDGRKQITLAHLLAMSSGLHFSEDYGTVTDVTRMLYLEPNMASFASSQQLDHAPGTFFSYASGTSVMLSRLWQHALGDSNAALNYPQQALFGPLGMQTAVLEADARGNFVGSSYLFASGRDWARFAQLLLQEGVWNGKALLPAGYVKMMRTPVASSALEYGRTQYGQGQLWLRGSTAGTPPGEDPDAGFVLPPDTFWLHGYDGQSIAIIPSLQLAVVRLGITPSKLGFKAQPLVMAVIKATSP